MTRSLPHFVAAPLLAAALAAPLAAQARLDAPTASPRASVTQRVGITEVSVEYSRPGLKGRDVLGDPTVIPMDNPQLAWRAGADENTVVSFEHDATVQGQPIAAGSYGLHVFPKSDGPWTVAFSTNTTAWGSYTYTPDEDALRVEVTPTEGPSVEWLRYDFTDLAGDGATLVLAWDTLRLPLEIGVDTQAHMLAYLRDEYTRGYGFWIGPQMTAAAQWCLNNDVNLEQALSWATRGAGGAPGYTAYMVKAGLEEKLGRTDAATASRAAAESHLGEAQRNALGYQFLQGGQVQRALEVFARNLELHPESWNAHDSLAEAHAAAGNTEKAVELYRKAREMAPDDANRQRIDAVLERLQG